MFPNQSQWQSQSVLHYFQIVLLSKNRKIKINSTSCWSHVKWKPVSEPPRNPWNFYWSAFLSKLQCCYGPENRARAFSLWLAGWDAHERARKHFPSRARLGQPSLGCAWLWALLLWVCDCASAQQAPSCWAVPGTADDVVVISSLFENSKNSDVKNT